jgi:hypothetical protein
VPHLIISADHGQRHQIEVVIYMDCNKLINLLATEKQFFFGSHLKIYGRGLKVKQVEWKMAEKSGPKNGKDGKKCVCGENRNDTMIYGRQNVKCVRIWKFISIAILELPSKL